MEHLPDLAIYQIISSLSFLPAVRLGVQSKKLYSIWQSFLKYEFQIDAKSNITKFQFDADGEPNITKFFENIYCILRDHPGNFLEKLSIRADFIMSDPHELCSSILSFGRLRELELINTDLGVYEEFFVLPEYIFCAKRIHTLKLDGFRFMNTHLLLRDYYRLQNLRLRRTTGIHTLTLKRNTFLRSLEIDYCWEELKLVELDATRLRHFICVGINNVECEVVISPNTRALKSLKLENVNVSKSLFQHESTPMFQRVEQLFLKLNQNMELKWIRLDWPNLKELELMGIPSLENINLLSQNLQSCVLHMASSPTCQIHFHHRCGKFLKSLTLLYSEVITSIWIEQNLTWFDSLENFHVEGCNNLELVKFCHAKIKNLEIIYCNALHSVDINTPSLESLEMSCNNSMIPSCKVIYSKLLRAKLSLFFGMLNPFHHQDLNQLLSTFNTVQELTLHLKSSFDKVFLDVTLITRLYDVKNLKIDFRVEEDISPITDLLKYLLWIFPLPKCLTFIMPTMKEQSIKFEYVDSNGDEVYSCSYYLEACQKHRSIKVQLNNFDDTRDKSIDKIKQLVEFLKRNASKFPNIPNDCDEVVHDIVSKGHFVQGSMNEIMSKTQKTRVYCL